MNKKEKNKSRMVKITRNLIISVTIVLLMAGFMSMFMYLINLKFQDKMNEFSWITWLIDWAIAFILAFILELIIVGSVPKLWEKVFAKQDAKKSKLDIVSVDQEAIEELESEIKHK